MTTPTSSSTPWSRRRVLRTLFCSSAVLSWNVQRRVLGAADAAAPGDLHWLAIGDFGSQLPSQTAVANGMKTYVARLGLKAPGLLLLGDNFYKKMEGGVESPRWKSGFEEIYPASVFPGPCPVVLGNHDYHDNAGGEQTQLAYAKTAGTRWTLPHKWYRMDFPTAKPLVTFYFLDTNVRSVSGADEETGKVKKNSLTAEEEAAQWAWLRAELKKPHAPWTVCAGHHPVFSNGKHGDTKELVKTLAPLLLENRVSAYLCGHDHDMQHLEIEQQATSFILSGGGGARVRELKKPANVFGQPVYGFTHIQANAERLVFRHVDANGKQLHAFEKRPDGSFAVQAG